MTCNKTYIGLFGVLCGLSLCLSSPTGPVQLSLESIKESQCGGTITRDTGTLAFPEDDEAFPKGGVCVWTIHLNTTEEFAFTFNHTGSSNSSGDCSDGGMHVYALSNLISPDRMEHYTFCAGKPAPSPFYLSGSLAVVVFYGSALNDQVGQFSLDWEGISFDPWLFRHMSSFSSASSGAIRYPIVGQYPPKLIATWLIDNPGIKEFDFTMESIALEECANPDPCTCDALILYEVSKVTGLLNETRRFCSDSTGTRLERIQPKFILAMFTDHRPEMNFTDGFSAIYYERDPPLGNPCGEIFTNLSSTISYKTESSLNSNERCMWTIHNPTGLEIEFHLREGNISGIGNGLMVSSFEMGEDSMIVYNQRFYSAGSRMTLKGEVAVVTIYTGTSEVVEGFVLDYEYTETRSASSNGSDVIVSSAISTHIDHPSSGGVYSDNEVSTFLYSPNFSYGSEGNMTTRVNVTMRGMEDMPLCDCCDFVHVYKFQDRVEGWSIDTKLCGNSGNTYFEHKDAILFIFKSDYSVGDSGFGLEFSSS